MKKSIDISNHFCPQTLFVYGTTKEDGTPNFGLFSWFSYYFDQEMGVMACIADEKLTKDRIRANKIFSASLVSEELLPIADYLGNTNGYAMDKMDIPIEIEKGRVLDVPILAKSPWIYELEVDRSIVLDGGDIFLCKIRNVLADEYICDETLTEEQRMQKILPVQSIRQSYFNWDGTTPGNWGEPMKGIGGKANE
ncbi:flavin reductase family protein [Candidatus Enterococcus ferrettii]|uniref:Flavin reductase like domain-containing protein n=1 Tax=Candidatus Enterococcus ferrettii TaxID=2815324 RepID=A0ABV0ER84_9ENTE|nr:flavin reductase [Enterococcus sp. 665A]MBO1341300.1 flavin reductase [Enterococcus sp. 665A]